MLLKFNVHHLGDLVKIKADLAGLGEAEIMHFNKKLPGDDSAAGPGTTLYVSRAHVAEDTNGIPTAYTKALIITHLLLQHTSPLLEYLGDGVRGLG